jgi:hypothetical protein
LLPSPVAGATHHGADAGFPGVAIHLQLCSACRLDHYGLREMIKAARRGGDDAASRVNPYA